MSKQPKSLNQKTSEKFLETLRSESPQTFKDIAKVLTLRERNSNNTECLSKFQSLLSGHAQLARTLNEYLEQSIRLPIQKTFTMKIEQLFSYVKTKNLEHLNVIIETLKKFDEEMKANGGIQTKESEEKLKKKFLELFKDDEETYNKAKDIFQDSQIKEKPAPEPPRKRGVQAADYLENTYKTKNIRVAKAIVEPPKPPPEPVKYPPDDMEFILKLEKSWSPAIYANISKVIFLFEHCIIGMDEALELIPEQIFENEAEYQALKDMIETREGSRRRTSNPFKPLNDTDFSNSIRATFSYVQMPWCYPILCRGKNKELRAILNDKWVSVPHGSEHSNFSIRTKNQFQELLLKSEDERYEFDIYFYRSKMCQKLLDKIINKPDMKEEEVENTLRHVIGMNIIQTIYKNTTKEQKEDLQRQLKHNLVNTCIAMKQRIINQSSALKNIRDVHGIKAWLEVAEKNFVKSLDRKCSEFKRNERDNTKAQFFEGEVEEKLRLLRKKERPNIFQESVSVFRILNSFQSYSKTERCHSHNIKFQDIPTYETENYTPKSLLPVLMLLFQNREVTTMAYTFFIYYVNSCIPNESERNKNKKIAAKFFEKILNFEYTVMNFSENFKQQQFFSVLNNSNALDGTSPPTLVASQLPGAKLFEDQRMVQQIVGEKRQLGIKDELEGEYAYLPLKGENSSVWYFSLNMHVVLRLIYTIYERLLKAMEILYDYARTGSLSGPVGAIKVNLFKILFMLHVKSKENSKFEDHLGELFGAESYMFSTIYKLFQSLIKALQTVAGDIFSSKLLDLIVSESNTSVVNNEALYLLQINRLTISMSNSDNLFRINHNHTNNLITVNYFKSYYKSWDDGKDKKLEEKLDEMQRNVEFYVTQPTIDHDIKNKSKKKEKKVSGSEGNRMQYFCFSTGLKLYSRVEYEDYFIQPGRRQAYGNKHLKKEIKRAKKAQQFLESLAIQQQ